jgi:hypothetical protein
MTESLPENHRGVTPVPRLNSGPVEEQGAGGGLSKHDLVPAGTDRDRGEPRRAVDEPQLEVEIA